MTKGYDENINITITGNEELASPYIEDRDDSYTWKRKVCVNMKYFEQYNMDNYYLVLNEKDNWERYHIQIKSNDRISSIDLDDCPKYFILNEGIKPGAMLFRWEDWTLKDYELVFGTQTLINHFDSKLSYGEGGNPILEDIRRTYRMLKLEMLENE